MFDGREPIYHQIADQIRAAVLDGSLPEGEQVMSTTQYATTYRINPATAAKAFTQLVDEGVLYKQRGVGMFVAAGARERLRAERRRHFFTEVVEPVAVEARLLGIDLEDVIARLRAAADDAGPAADDAGPAAPAQGDER